MNIVDCKIRSGKDLYLFRIVYRFKKYKFHGYKNRVEYTMYETDNVYDAIAFFVSEVESIKRPE